MSASKSKQNTTHIITIALPVPCSDRFQKLVGWKLGEVFGCSQEAGHAFRSRGVAFSAPLGEKSEEAFQTPCFTRKNEEWGVRRAWRRAFKGDLEKRVSLERGRENWPSGNLGNRQENYRNLHFTEVKRPNFAFSRTAEIAEGAAKRGPKGGGLGILL